MKPGKKAGGVRGRVPHLIGNPARGKLTRPSISSMGKKRRAREERQRSSTGAQLPKERGERKSLLLGSEKRKFSVFHTERPFGSLVPTGETLRQIISQKTTYKLECRELSGMGEGKSLPGHAKNQKGRRKLPNR